MLLSFFLNNFFKYDFLFPAVIAQIFNPTVEVAMPTGISSVDGKAEMETHSVTIEAK